MDNAVTNKGPEIIVLKFADSKIPVFKESRTQDYIKYGDNNRYCDYLTYLFDKSAKHNAILTGKADYIFGNGYANGDTIVNRLGESLNDISKKSILDIRVYGGYYWELVYNRLGKIAEIYHVDFTTIRLGKEGGFYWKENWESSDREDPEFISAFNPSQPYGTQIYAYKEYRPKTRFYPLPDYIGTLNYIETDIEISKFYLSSIRNGMAPSKMIQFFSGDPGIEGKREIEGRIKEKYTGSENAGRFFLVFNEKNAQRSVEVNDLSSSDLDKMFVELNKTVQQEVFSGHKVTSPALFGVKTEGQLGSTQELKVSYDIFRNTYASIKADDYDREVNNVMQYTLWPGVYELEHADPIGLQFDVKDVISSIPKTFIFKQLGIPEDEWANPGTDGLPVIEPSLDSDIKVNHHIKNLTGRQHQEMQRIINQYNKGLQLPGSKGSLTEAQARVLLKTGLGFTDDEVNELLGIKPVQMSSQLTEDAVIEMFDSCGDSKNDYEILKSKAVHFSSDEEIAEDEMQFIEAAFKTYDVTYTEKKIIELIRQDQKITVDVIAQAIGETKNFVRSKIESLTKRGYLETTKEGGVITMFVPKEQHITAPPKAENVAISVKYSYEVKPGVGPEIIPTTRPFCRKLISLNRVYTRKEIESISARLGYSVWDRKGGWYGKSPECRHRWEAHLVVKKEVINHE